MLATHTTLFAVLTVLLFVAVPAAAQQAGTRYRVPVTRHEPADGPADALVTIVAFTDYQCPFSMRAQPTLAQLRHDHPNDLRIVHRNMPLPFHDMAETEAEAAMEAFAQGGDPLFWRFHDRLFAVDHVLTRPEIESIAQSVGVDVVALRRALDGQTHAAEIQSDQLIANAFGARGTPAFFVDGILVLGAQPLSAFEDIVRGELASAQTLVRRGVPRDRVYAALTADGLTGAAPSDPSAPPPPRRIPDPATVYAVPVGGALVRGPADALVTIVMFTDLQCPFCSRAHRTMLDIAQLYGNDVRFVLKNNPLSFHPHALPAARLVAWAGASGKAWPLVDRIFENQMSMADDDLVADAVALGLDEAGARAALADGSLDRAIREDQALATQLGASGTPSFFINGHNLRGAQPLATFRTAIDEALAAARQRVAAGVRRGAVYDAIVAGGAHEPHMIDGPPSAPSPGPRFDADHVYALPVPRGAATRGAAHGRVIIQEFSDFECPFCSRVEPTIADLMTRYGDRVTFVWRDFPLPFHTHAMQAAEAAREIMAQAGAPAFWRYHDVLFRNQLALERADLERYASELGGIDMARFRAALDTHRHQAAVQADIDAVNASGASIGTPSFFFDGHLMQGAQPLDAFVTQVDAALAAAHAPAAPSSRPSHR